MMLFFSLRYVLSHVCLLTWVFLGYKKDIEGRMPLTKISQISLTLKKNSINKHWAIMRPSQW